MFKLLIILAVLTTVCSFHTPRASMRSTEVVRSNSEGRWTPMVMTTKSKELSTQNVIIESDNQSTTSETPITASVSAVPISTSATSPSDMKEISYEEPVAPMSPTTFTNTAKISAKWIPIGGISAPALLDGTLAGDCGFDPLGFARSKNGLYWMREAEVKHARLAMLAAVGWPLSELWHKSIAQTVGLQSILAANDRAPSILNGGLSNNWVTAMLMMGIVASGFLENKAMNSGEIFWANDKPEGYVPGDLGFDPLNLYGKRGGDKKAMEEAEIKNGRLAMLAITGYAFAEFASKMPVVEQTPYLF